MVNENAGINHTQEEYIMNDETRLRGFGDLAENEDGMGTIEVILIIVEYYILFI